MIGPSYPDNLTDKEWNYIKPFVSVKTGRPTKHSQRVTLDGIFYLLRTGCSWRHLPKDFPNWKTVYTQYRRWVISGVFEKIHNKLRDKIRKKKINLLAHHLELLTANQSK